MNAILIVLACLAILVFFALLLGFLLLIRYFNYREKTSSAQQDIAAEKKPRRNAGLLIWGWLVTILSLLAVLSFWAFGAFFLGEGVNYPLGMGPWMLLGLVPLFFGLCLLLLYVLLAPRPTKTPPETNA